MREKSAWKGHRPRRPSRRARSGAILHTLGSSVSNSFDVGAHMLSGFDAALCPSGGVQLSIGPTSALCVPSVKQQVGEPRWRGEGTETSAAPARSAAPAALCYPHDGEGLLRHAPDLQVGRSHDRLIVSSGVLEAPGPGPRLATP